MTTTHGWRQRHTFSCSECVCGWVGVWERERERERENQFLQWYIKKISHFYTFPSPLHIPFTPPHTLTPPHPLDFTLSSLNHTSLHPILTTPHTPSLLLPLHPILTPHRELERQYREQVRELQEAVVGEREAAREQVSAAAKELQTHTSHLQEEDSRLKAAITALTAVRWIGGWRSYVIGWFWVWVICVCVCVCVCVIEMCLVQWLKGICDKGFDLVIKWVSICMIRKV